MFYSMAYLIDSKEYYNKYNDTSGQLSAPNITAVAKQWERVVKYYTGIDIRIASGELSLTKLHFSVKTDNKDCHARISLVVSFTNSDSKIKEELVLSQATINTIQNNCGTIQITDVTNCGFPGWGHYVVEEIIRWAKFAGYTNIIGNTAGPNQNGKPLTWFKKKFGAVEFGPHYINKRSKNTNIWFQIPLVDQDTLTSAYPDDPEDDNNVLEGDNYEDGEEF